MHKNIYKAEEYEFAVRKRMQNFTRKARDRRETGELIEEIFDVRLMAFDDFDTFEMTLIDLCKFQGFTLIEFVEDKVVLLPQNVVSNKKSYRVIVMKDSSLII